MANPVVVNNQRLGGHITLRCVGSGFINLSQCNAVAAEVVNEMTLVGATWSVSNGGFFTVQRGGTSTLILSNSGDIDLKGKAIVTENAAQAAGNVVVTLTRSPATESILYLKFHKRSSGATYE